MADGRPTAIDPKGIIRNQTKIGVEDGTMHDLINLRFKDGSWRTSGDGKRVTSFINISSGLEYKQLYVHVGPKYKHLLGVRDGYLYWFANIDNDGQTFTPVDPVMLTAITGDMYINQTGHLITIIDGEDNFEYFVFKIDENELGGWYYKQVKVDENGEQSARGIYPFGRAHFNLYSPMDGSDYVFYSNKDNGGNEFAKLNKNHFGLNGPVSDSLTNDKLIDKKTYQNLMVATWGRATESNKFTNPFLAMVACELYDGSWVFSSNPVLIWPHDKLSSQELCYYISSAQNYVDENKKTNEYHEELVKNRVYAVDSEGGRKSFIRRGSVLVNLGGNASVYYKDGTLAPTEPSDKSTNYKLKAYVHAPVCLEIGDDYDRTKFLRRPRLVRYTDFPVMSCGCSLFAESINPALADYVSTSPECYVWGSDLTLSLSNTDFLDKYSDVFKSIGIFITKPADIYKMEADKSYEGAFVDVAFDKSVEISTGDPLTRYYQTYIMNIGYVPERRSNQDIIYDLMHSPFYLLRKYNKTNINELNDPRVKLTDTEYKNVLKNIVQQQRLELESTSRMTYLPKVAYSYNHRLHIANYKATQFHGYPIDMFQLHNHMVYYSAGSYMNGVLPNLHETSSEDHRQFAKTEYNFFTLQFTNIKQIIEKLKEENKAFAFVQVKINTGDGEQVVTRYIEPYNAVGHNDGEEPNFIEYLNPLLTFPDMRATDLRLVFITINRGQIQCYDQWYKLTPSTVLNMAYYINPGLSPLANSYRSYSGGSVADLIAGLPNDIPSIPPEQNNVEYYPNGLKVSKTNNPFYFPVENTYGVGQSAILALMSNTMPVGTGQTGAAPLYVFCQDGVYALFVDASGEMAYPNSRILSRDVLSVPRSVTPIDNGVVFITERGLMCIAGFDVQEIGQPAEGDVEDLREPVGGTWDTTKKFIYNRATLEKLGNLPAEIFDGVDFLTYMNDTRNNKETLINYNHNERELIVCNPNYPYSYVLDRYKQWSRRDYTADQFVNNFPTSYRVKNGVFYKMDDEGDISDAAAVKVNKSEADNAFFALSNPMKLGSIGFKEAHRFVVRGQFQTDTIKHVVEEEEYTQNYQPLGPTPIYKTINLPATVDGTEWAERDIQLIDPIDFTIPEHSMILEYAEGHNSHLAFNGRITVTLADSDCVFRGYVRPSRKRLTMDARMLITNRDTGEIVFAKPYSEINLSDDAKTVTLDLSDEGTLPFSTEIQAGNYRFSLVMDKLYLRQVYTKDEEEIEEFVSEQIPTVSFGDTDVVLEGSELVRDYQITESDPLHIPLVTSYFDYHTADEVKGKISGKLHFIPTVNGEIEDAVFKRPPSGSNITMTYGLKLSKYDATNDTYVTVFDVEIPMFLDDFFDEDLLIVDFDDFIDFSVGNTKISDVLNERLNQVAWEDGAKYKFELYHEDSNLYVHLQDSYEYEEYSLISVTAGNGSDAAIEITSKKVNTPNYQFIVDTELNEESSDDSDDSSDDDAGYEIADFGVQLYTETHVEHEPSKLGCYVFGSYDGRKWALLGGNERTGDFTDIGCLVERTDMKFFRVCLAGQLKGKSRIDYMEISTEPSVLNTKIR